MKSRIDLKRVQDRLMSMAISIRDILELYDIPYVITYGTLLGAVRHNGFIPWDDDFDFYLFDDSYDRALTCLRNNLPNNLFLEDESSEPFYFHGWAHVKDLESIAYSDRFPQDNLYSHHGLSVDLYKAKRIPFSELEIYETEERIKYLERKDKAGLFVDPSVIIAEREKLCSLKSSNHEERTRDVYAFMSLDGGYFELDELYPFKRYSFESSLFTGPNNFDSFLKRCYGDYMSLPPAEDQVSHYSSVSFLNPE